MALFLTWFISATWFSMVQLCHSLSAFIIDKYVGWSKLKFLARRASVFIINQSCKTSVKSQVFSQLDKSRPYLATNIKSFAIISWNLWSLCLWFLIWRVRVIWQILQASIYDRKTAATRFDIIHAIPRSLSLAQCLIKGRNAPIWR